MIMKAYKNMLLMVLLLCMNLQSITAQEIIPFRVKDQWGFADTAGRIISKCEYDSVSWKVKYFGHSHYTWKNGKQGLVTFSSFYNDGRLDSVQSYTIAPLYDSIRTDDWIVKAYSGGQLAVYDFYANLLLPLQHSTNIYFTILPSPTGGSFMDKRAWKHSEKLIRLNEAQYRKDQSFAKYGEALLLKDNEYYRIVPEGEFPRTSLLKVKLSKQVKATVDERQKRMGRPLRKRNETTIVTNWYEDIPVYPRYGKTDIKDTLDLLTSFEDADLRYTFRSGIYDQAYKPSSGSVIRRIKNLYPDYGLLFDSGKVGIGYKKDEYKNGKRSTIIFNMVALPVYDRLLAIQDGERYRNTFYMMKGDSIAVISGVRVMVVPVHPADHQRFKYADDQYYFKLVPSSDTNRIELYYSNTCFNPGIINYKFDLVLTGSDWICIENNEMFQAYRLTVTKTNLIQFEKQLEVSGAQYIDFRGHSGYNIRPASLVLQLADGKLVFYTQDKNSSQWKKIYEADKMLEKRDGFYKVLEQGRAGYVNAYGKKYFTN
jgi:hypothetical protein